MPNVVIKGIPGSTWFPDEMSQEQIQEAIEKDILPQYNTQTVPKRPPPELRTAPPVTPVNPGGVTGAIGKAIEFLRGKDPTLYSEETQARYAPGEYLEGGPEGVLGRAAEAVLPYAPGATRIASQMLAKTPLIGSAMGAAGEHIAQSMEMGTGQRGIGEANQRKVVTGGVLGSFMPRAGMGWRAGLARGGGVGATQTVIEKAIEERRLPTLGEGAVGTLTGMLIGAGLGKLNQVTNDKRSLQKLADELTVELDQPVNATKFEVMTGLALKYEKEDAAKALAQQRSQLMGAMQQRVQEPLARNIQSTWTQGQPTVAAPYIGGQDIGGEMMAKVPELLQARAQQQQGALARHVESAWSQRGPLVQPPFAGGSDVTGDILSQQRWQGGEMLPPFREMFPLPKAPPPSPTATSSLLQAAQQTLRPATPAVEPPSPTSSLLQQAQNVLTGQKGGSNIFGDWARRIVNGPEPEEFKNVPYMDLLQQHRAAKLSGNVEQTKKLQEAIVARVPSGAIAKQVTEWFGKDTATKVMKNPTINAVTGANVPGNVVMFTNAAIQQAAALAKSPAMKMDKRVSRQAALAFLNGDIEAPDAMKVMQEEGTSFLDFVIDVMDETSRGGKVLNRMSQLRKTLDRMVSENPQSQDIIDSITIIDKPITKRERIDWAGEKYINLWRGLMVLQPKTFMRNLQTGAGATTMEAFDMMAQGNFLGAKNIAEMSRHNFIEGFTNIGKFTQSQPGKGDELAKVFDRFKLHGKRMGFDREVSPAKDAALGQYVHAANFLNRTQDQWFKRTIFAAHLKTWADRKGHDFNTVLNNPQMIPGEVMDYAVKRAEKVVFQAMPESSFGKKYVELFANNPVLYLLNPFPRFQANAMRFMYEHSPLGLMRLVNDRHRAVTGAGRLTTDREIVAQAATGSLMFAAALALRFSPLRGEHWYTVKVGNDEKNIMEDRPLKRVDVRPYAPFTGYPFLAEAAKNLWQHGELRMTDQDLKAGAQALMLRGGAGYSLGELYFGNDPMTSLPNGLARVAGGILSGFTVPFRTPKDLVSSIEYAVNGESEEAKYRDVREHPILGPAVQNIPFASRLLPEGFLPASPNPLVPGESYQSDYPTIGQWLGVNLSNLTPLEAEVERVGIPPRSIRPATGVSAADRAIAEQMAPMAAMRGQAVMDMPFYQEADREMQAGMMNQELDKARAAAGMTALEPFSPTWMEMTKERFGRSTTPMGITKRRMFELMMEE